MCSRACANEKKVDTVEHEGLVFFILFLNRTHGTDGKQGHFAFPELGHNTHKKKKRKKEG